MSVRSLSLSLLSFALGPLAWAQPAATWKLNEPKEKEALQWVQGEKKVSAIADSYTKILSSAPRVKTGDGVPHALAIVPRFGFTDGSNGAGAVFLLEPGRVAKAPLTMKASLPGGGDVDLTGAPSEILLHKEGFFFSYVVGPSTLVGTFQIEGEKATVFTSLDTQLLRNNETSFELTPTMVTVKARETKTFFDRTGAKVDGVLEFHELTPENETALKNTYKAVDLVAEAKLGRINGDPRREDLQKRLDRIFVQGGAKSALLVETKSGVDGEAVVHEVARRMAEKKLKLFGSDEWRLYEVSWKVLNTEGQVNLTIDKVRKLFDVARQKRVILYFPDAEQLKGLGVDRGVGTNDATSAMAADMAAGRVIVLGKTNTNGQNILQTGAKAFYETVTPVKVEPATNEVALLIAKDYAAMLEKRSGVKISDALVKRSMEMANQFVSDNEVAQPGKTKAVLKLMAASPTTYGLTADKEGKYVATEDSLKKVVAEYTGIATLGETDKKSTAGLKAFIKKENYWKTMDRLMTGGKEAKTAVLNALTMIADDRPAKADVTGNEVGVPVILLLGPSGTGKTHLPNAVSKGLKEFGVIWDPITLEGGVLTNAANVATLTGAPPSYVGYKEEGAKFLQQIKEKKQGLIVFDEVDKAHPDIFKPLYSFFEFGKFQDSNLNEARFTRGVVFLTANWGAQGNQQKEGGNKDGASSDIIDQFDRWKMFKTEPRDADVKTMTERQLKNRIREELIQAGKISEQVLGRIGEENIIILHHFTLEQITELTKQWEVTVADRFLANAGAKLEFTPAASKWFISEAWGEDGKRSFRFGARAVIDVMDKLVYPYASRTVKDGKFAEMDLSGKTFVLDVDLTRKTEAPVEFLELRLK